MSNKKEMHQKHKGKSEAQATEGSKVSKDDLNELVSMLRGVHEQQQHFKDDHHKSGGHHHR
jgi:hypothetical protein